MVTDGADLKSPSPFFSLVDYYDIDCDIDAVDGRAYGWHNWQQLSF